MYLDVGPYSSMDLVWCPLFLSTLPRHPGAHPFQVPMWSSNMGPYTGIMLISEDTTALQVRASEAMQEVSTSEISVAHISVAHIAGQRPEAGGGLSH